ncbi:hypothetical protein L0669_17195 [Flavobacterium bizetiae]|uniref:hypothetical protein n=1 Tax=Flavobacterium bizetiae TaxID=2704140 RepID=UPI0021E6F312|nr:hypothetical protein [Flavobacterium bizetiae]UTN03062.1 hypothetical protein L0669_17195 [Flavobacterium bizetiae]
MKYSEEIQKLLPLGYIYLVILGILKESIFYYQLGINILKYSTIMDILLSPIAEFTSNPITLLFIILLFVFHYNLPKIFLKYRNNRTLQKIFEVKSAEKLSEDEMKNYYIFASFKMFAVILLSFFIGTGVAGGYSTIHRIRENKIDYNYTLNYNSGESEQIYLISTNSIYYFYVEKGDKSIQIAPIGSIKNIKKGLKVGILAK